MVTYSDNLKFAFFNGLKFTRDDKTGYFLNSTIRKRLHRAVWEKYNGKIPKNMEIHHKDLNKSNNDITNLVLIQNLKHRRLHGEMLTLEQRDRLRENLNKTARPKAIEWHKSKAGSEWHKKHYEKIKNRLHQEKNFICEQCGKAFTSTQSESRFCSNACKSAWRRVSGIDNEKRRCEYCGKQFITNKYSGQRFCTKSCANRAIPRLPVLRKNQSY